MFGVICYGLAALVWFGVLSTESLSTSYPVLVGLTFIMVAIGGVFFFQESFGLQKFIAMAMILGGIVVAARV
ncbi:hypothetical protein N9H39_00945 [Gammaproteobacteria bacterium]|nr:hypothetical protein [Gammaproteobacteria bacterium]